MAEERATAPAYLQCQDCGQVSEAPQERCPNCGGTKLFEQRAEMVGESLTTERDEEGATERSDSEVREDVAATQDEQRYGGPVA